MHFSAIIFDLDGTLLDTLRDIANAANTVLAGHGIPTRDIDEYRYFVGDGMRMLIHRALPEGKRSGETMDDLVEEFRRVYVRNWNVTTRPYPGVSDMLDAVSSRPLGLAVLSNKPDNFTKMCVTEFLSAWTFDVVLGSRPEAPRKPDPTTALAIARTLGVVPKQILYLGDSAVDMKTATAAGMFPVGALWGFRSRTELEESGAQALIERPADLVPLLHE